MEAESKVSMQEDGNGLQSIPKAELKEKAKYLCRNMEMEGKASPWQEDGSREHSIPAGEWKQSLTLHSSFNQKSPFFLS